MVSKSQLKSDNKKLKKRVKRLKKIMKIGVKSINERDTKIGQLTSILEQENKDSQRIKASGK